MVHFLPSTAAVAACNILRSMLGIDRATGDEDAVTCLACIAALKSRHGGGRARQSSPLHGPRLPEGRRVKRRVRHFRVAGKFDGAPVATVAIVPTADGGWIFEVRPLRRRRVFAWPLADVARGIVYDVVKRELAERRRERGRKR